MYITRMILDIINNPCGVWSILWDFFSNINGKIHVRSPVSYYIPTRRELKPSQSQNAGGSVTHGGRKR